MEYCGFEIRVEKSKFYKNVLVRTESLFSGYRGSDKEKSTLMSWSTLTASIQGEEIADMAFIFELRTILEEFCAKRLGDCKPGKTINEVTNIYGNTTFYISIEREGSQLVFKKGDSRGSEEIILYLDTVRARTLSAIITKAINYSDFS